MTDAGGSQEFAATSINVNTAMPIADAEVTADDCIAPNSWVDVDASSSSHPEDGELSYEWQFVSTTGGSEFEDYRNAQTRLWLGSAGEHQFRVRVTDEDGHSDLSEIITLDVDAEADISVISGDDQIAEVDHEFDDEFVVTVANQCGAPMRLAQLIWESDNASFTAPTFTTNPDGTAKTKAIAGTRAGASTLRASVEDAEAEFAFEVTPGPVTGVLFEQPDDSFVVSDTDGVELVFKGLDEYGNETDGEGEIEFRALLGKLEWDGSLNFSDAVFEEPGEDGDAEKTIHMKDGVATATIYNTTPERVFIGFYRVINADDAFYSRAWIDLKDEDFEAFDGEDSRWSFSGSDNWEIGEPSSGPSSAISGANVLGTVLDGDYYETTAGPSTATMEFSGLYPTVGSLWSAEVMEVTFSHYFEAAEDPNLDVLEFQDEACALALGRVSIDGQSIEPSSGYDGLPHCNQDWSDGFAGFQQGAQSFTEVDFSSSQVGDLMFSFHTSGDTANDNFYTDAGWYIDDINVRIRANGGMVDFEAGEPERLDGWTADGMAGGAEATAYFQLTDAYDNELSQAGVEIEATVDPDNELSGNPSITGIAEGYGSDFHSSDGLTATAQTNEDGVVAFRVFNDEVEEFTMGAEIAAVSNSYHELSADFVGFGETVIEVLNDGIAEGVPAVIGVRAQDSTGDYVIASGIEFELELEADADAIFSEALVGSGFSTDNDGRSAWVKSDSTGEVQVAIESDEPDSFEVSAMTVGEYEDPLPSTSVTFDLPEAGDSCGYPLSTSSNQQFIYSTSDLCADDFSRIGGAHACGGDPEREDVYFEFEVVESGDYFFHATAGDVFSGEIMLDQCSATPQCVENFIGSSIYLEEGQTGIIRILHPTGEGCSDASFFLRHVYS